MFVTEKHDPVKPQDNHEANNCREGHPGAPLTKQFPPSQAVAKCSLQMRKPGSSRMTWQMALANVPLSQPPSLELPPEASVC